MPQPKTLTPNHLAAHDRIERTLTRAAVLLRDLADITKNPNSQIAPVSFDDLNMIDTRLDDLEADIGKLIQPQIHRPVLNAPAPFILTHPVGRNHKFSLEMVLAKISAENGPRTG
ncbi:MAG: hypothetical protein KUG69_01715 [Marinosulfonomonas sp.]|nr:hypothetical protein [Marinosulfonomonas sp.]